MGLLGKLFGKKPDGAEEKKPAGNEANAESGDGGGKYNETCSLCGGSGSDKKWMGQYWHKKCLRSMKKGARKMV
ncbi:MAG: hypothetical protein HY394_04990 [Candidatus Diapherotrites archaeon]|nr:hypothetical protein [Candidatus Diapherotrites archaeon]